MPFSLADVTEAVAEMQPIDKSTTCHNYHKVLQERAFAEIAFEWSVSGRGGPIIEHKLHSTYCYGEIANDYRFCRQ